jgi:hypothetical protein
MASNQYARYFGGGAGNGSSAGVSSLNGATGAINILPGTGITVSTVGQNITISAINAGTVTSVSVVTANGLSGTVANPTTTPAITLAPTFTGIAYSTGSAFQTAVAGNFPILNQNTTGTAANITATTNSTLITLSALSLPFSQVTGTVPVNQGGTGDTSFTAYSPIVGGTTSTGALQSVSNSGATIGQVLTYQGTGALPTWTTVSSGGGSVTSVALALPVSVFTVSGSPVTTSGTLTGSFTTQSPNTFFSGPTTGPSATPTFRAIANADLASITTLSSLSLPGSQVTGNISGNAGNITATSNSTLTTLSALSLPTSQLSGTISLTTQVSGILPVSNGGTGVGTFSANQVILGGTTSTGPLTQVAGGTSGYVLTSTGPTSAPTWQPSSGGGGGSVVTFKAMAVGTPTPGANNPIIFSSVYDTNSGFNGSTGQYTIPAGQGGYWRFGGTFQVTGPAPGNIYITQNGTGVNYISTPGASAIVGNVVSGWTEFDVSAGDVITWQDDANDTFANTSYYIATKISSGTTSLSIGALDSGVANSTGLYLTGTTLSTQSASSSNPGMVNNTSQTFSGSKNFTSPIGYNNATPASNTALDIINTTGAAQRIVQTGYGGTVGLRGRYANGTLGSPTAAVSGNILNFFSGLGYGASQFAASSTGAINVVAGETFTNASNATYLQFSVTPTGSVTSSEAMRVSPAGNLLIATTTDTGQKLQVNGTAIFSGAVTDSVAPIFSSLTGYLYGNGSSAVTASTTIPTSVLSGTVAIANGGTNASTVTGARTNLGIDSGTQFITSGTTYTTPAGITTATIFKFVLIGGGGGGGGINTASANGSGGGGGGGVVLYAQGLSPSTAYTISIGGAGTGGTSTTTAATAGGATTITLSSVTYTANGGGAGADTVSTAGGAGGAPSNTFASGFAIGGYNITGKAGRGSTLANADSFSGDGGDAALGYGHGGPPFTTGTAGNGAVGVGYGGGGSGGRGATANGGNGTGGCIVVEYYN